DRVYFVQLTVTNENGVSDTYPNNMDVTLADTAIITFILDKTPPGSYKVCGTDNLVPVPYDNAANDKFNIKANHDDPINLYLQTDNYYWDEVWVEWDGGNTEIVREDSPWIDKKEVTVRVKVKDKNNENEYPLHRGHGTDEFDERDTDCSGISLDAQYRYHSTLMAPDEWSNWIDCNEVRLFDDDAHDSEGVTLNMGSEKNTFVWLYAKSVKFENGDTNLIQFRIKDEGDLEVPPLEEDRFKKDVYGDTQEIWIAPNIGYSHADTAEIPIVPSHPAVKFQVASNEFGYPIQIDTDKPQLILINYPSNPCPHRFASFKWIAVDTTPCRYKLKLEYWKDGVGWTFTDGGGAIDGEDQYEYSDNESNWQTGLPGGTPGIPDTFTSFDGLQVGKWYRFWVKAKDQDGAECDGLGQSPCSRRVSDDVIWVWYVSPEVPDTIITYGPSGQTTDSSPTFRWKAVGGTPPYTYQGWLRGPNDYSENVGSGETSHTFSSLEVGTYIFEVRAIDTNGSDPTPARRIFTVVDSNRPPYSTVSPKNLYKYFREMGE
ncbi:MAG: hypothetical protein V1709_08235, partial [Planctomycetota bacterium]